MQKKAIVLLASGFEEIEAVTPIDVLRRAGVHVSIVGLGAQTIAGAHGISLKADEVLDERLTVEVEKATRMLDMLVIPGGGPGADNLAASELVARLVHAQAKAGRWIAAICASPAVVLAKTGVLNNRQVTCYPGYEDFFAKAAEITPRTERVIRDGSIITSRGPGTALEFALELARVLAGDATADKLTAGMLAMVESTVVA